MLSISVVCICSHFLMYENERKTRPSRVKNSGKDGVGPEKGIGCPSLLLSAIPWRQGLSRNTCSLS